MKKVLKSLCTILVIAFFVFFSLKKYKMYQTVYFMATDVDNKVITEIWDNDHLERYKYLVIPSADFRANTIDVVKYPYNKVTDIGENAFQNNTYIKSVYIPVNIVRIRSNAFKGCTSIQSVYYAGTEQQWRQIVIEDGNESLVNATIEYNKKSIINRQY